MEPKLKPIDEQVVVITGASSGIGLATAQDAARAGAKLVLAARSEKRLAEIVDSINEEGGEAIYVLADVGKQEDVRRVADAAVERFGRIDTWVNDAGVAIYGRLDQVNDADSRRLFDTNFWGVVYGSKPKLPTPQIDPHDVAQAILKAATEVTRDVKVGMMSKINTTMAPSLGDKIAAKQADRQQYDQPPSRDPQGALWRASGGGDISRHRPPA
jgi:short-subunit dehydrogenase